MVKWTMVFLFTILGAVSVFVMTVVYVFSLALADTLRARRKRRRGYSRPVVAIASRPGQYVPRWGAFRRRTVAREHALWEEDFARALVK